MAQINTPPTPNLAPLPQAQTPLPSQQAPLKPQVPVHLKQAMAAQFASKTSDAGSSSMPTEMQDKEGFKEGRGIGGHRGAPGRTTARREAKEKEKREKTQDSKKAKQKKTGVVDDKNYVPVEGVEDRFDQPNDEDDRADHDAKIAAQKKATPFQQFQGLQKERRDVESMPAGEVKAARLARVDQKMSDLQENHGEQIREGIQKIEGIDRIRNLMVNAEKENRDLSPLELKEIRRLGLGKTLESFKDPAVADVMDEYYGEHAQTAVRIHNKHFASKISVGSSDAGRSPHRSMPGYILTIQDLGVFSRVNSIYTTSREMLAELAEKLAVSPLLPYQKLGSLLLQMADGGYGKGKVSPFVAKIVEVDRKDHVKRAAAHRIIAAHIVKMPTVHWPPDKISARREFLDELERTAANAHGALPVPETSNERREQELRQTADNFRARPERPERPAARQTR